jgi:hypothetical protein
MLHAAAWRMRLPWPCGGGREADEKPLWELGAGVTVLAFPTIAARTERAPCADTVRRLSRRFQGGPRRRARVPQRKRQDPRQCRTSFPVDSSDNDARRASGSEATVELGPAVASRWTAAGRLNCRWRVALRVHVERSPEWSAALARLNLDIKTRRLVRLDRPAPKPGLR